MQQDPNRPPFHDETREEAGTAGTPVSRLSALRTRFNSFYTRYRGVFLFVAMVCVSVATVLVYNATRPPPQRLTQHDIETVVGRVLETTAPKPSFASQVFPLIAPSVVRVEALSTSNQTAEEAFGSGVIIDDAGSILTCLHVVKNAVSVSVTFADGTRSEADIVGVEAETDLALLQPRIVPDDVVPAVLGGSPQIGDEVAAVGHPFGMSYSLSAGVVSGLGRDIMSPDTGERMTGLIQFDAAVNPGNSGGPLVDRNGEVVGIVTSLLNPTGDDVFIGIGFAVPMETAGGLAGAPPV